MGRRKQEKKGEIKMGYDVMWKKFKTNALPFTSKTSAKMYAYSMAKPPFGTASRDKVWKKKLKEYKIIKHKKKKVK